MNVKTEVMNPALRLIVLPLVAIGMVVSGCGRMTPPIAPERLSAEAVGDLVVSAEPSGVAFSWSAPQRDQRGKPLNSLEGYDIVRYEIDPLSIVKEVPDSDFVTVGSVEDRSFSALRAEQERLKAEGLPIRRARIAADLKAYSFTDGSAQPGRTYLYRVLGVNQGGERGAIGQQARVVFRGQNSEVTMAAPGSGQFDQFDGDVGNP